MSPISVERLEREFQETKNGVAAYKQRVEAKDSEQEAAIAALAEQVRALQEELAGQPAVQAKLEEIANGLDEVQATIAEPVPPPVPEPEPPPEPPSE